MKKAKGLILAAVVLSLLAGCGRSSLDETAVSVSKDGVVTAAVFDTLDQSYYDADELKENVESSVADYNSEAGEDTITVDKFEVSEDNDVELVMTYASYEDYADFNNVDFYVGDITDAYNNGGYRFEITFSQVEKGKVTEEGIAREDIFAGSNHSLIIFSEDMAVEVPGNILYVSSNVEVTGKKSARMSDGSAQSETDSETEEESDGASESTETETEDDIQEVTPTVEIINSSDSDTTLAYIIYE